MCDAGGGWTYFATLRTLCKVISSLLGASLNLSLTIGNLNTILEISHMNGKTSNLFLISLWKKYFKEVV